LTTDSPFTGEGVPHGLLAARLANEYAIGTVFCSAPAKFQKIRRARFNDSYAAFGGTLAHEPKSPLVRIIAGLFNVKSVD
jgi:hypothetical protein